MRTADHEVLPRTCAVASYPGVLPWEPRAVGGRRVGCHWEGATRTHRGSAHRCVLVCNRAGQSALAHMVWGPRSLEAAQACPPGGRAPSEGAQLTGFSSAGRTTPATAMCPPAPGSLLLACSLALVPLVTGELARCAVSRSPALAPSQQPPSLLRSHAHLRPAFSLFRPSCIPALPLHFYPHFPEFPHLGLSLSSPMHYQLQYPLYSQLHFPFSAIFLSLVLCSAWYLQ